MDYIDVGSGTGESAKTLETNFRTDSPLEACGQFGRAVHVRTCVSGTGPLTFSLAMKRALYLLAGICWMLFAFGFLFLLYEYLAQGAGLQFWIRIVSSESIFVGLVQFIGFSAASILCFAIGSGLWAHGLTKPDPEKS